MGFSGPAEKGFFLVAGGKQHLSSLSEHNTVACGCEGGLATGTAVPEDPCLIPEPKFQRLLQVLVTGKNKIQKYVYLCPPPSSTAGRNILVAVNRTLFAGSHIRLV